MMIDAAYPTELFQQLWLAKKKNRLPHALLWVGLKGTNKALFAKSFSKALLCAQVADTGVPCCACHVCHLVENRVHPNLLWIEPEKEGSTIKVDQIRIVSEFTNQTSLQGEYRIVIIHPADNMNINAANALLKTLEEPASGALLVLISDQLGKLPATILSRCQRVIFPSPNKEQTLLWLREQPERQHLFQALVALVEGKGDIIKSAAALQDADPVLLIDFFLSWVIDLIRLQVTLEVTNIFNSDCEAMLLMAQQKTIPQKMVRLMDSLQQLRSQCSMGINFNKQLMLESLFMQWMGCVRC